MRTPAAIKQNYITLRRQQLLAVYFLLLLFCLRQRLVWALDPRSQGHGFDSRLDRCQVTTSSKENLILLIGLFEQVVHSYVSLSSSAICYWLKGGDLYSLEWRVRRKRFGIALAMVTVVYLHVPTMLNGLD